MYSLVKVRNFGVKVSKFINVKPDGPVGNYIIYPTTRNSIFVLTILNSGILLKKISNPSGVAFI